MKKSIETQLWHTAMKTTIVQQWKQQRNTRMKNNNHTTIDQQLKTIEIHKWNTRMKHNNQKQHWNTAVTQKWKTTMEQQWKQQWKTRMKKRTKHNSHATNVQPWKRMKRTNETRQYITTTKNITETNQRHWAMKNNNRTTMKMTMKYKNEKKPMKQTNET